MATQLQIRRGTSTQVAAFTGAEGEIVVNTTNDSVHVNDGSTAGGFEMARADLNNVSDTSLNAALTGNTVSALTITTLTLGATAITATGAELNILDGVTATATELNLLDGVTATTAELNYVDGVTSAIQTQIDTKAPLASPTFTGTVTATGLTVATSTDPASITLRQTGNTSGFILKNFDDDEAQLVNVDNGPMVFKTNDTERLRITGAGAVGIGETNPAAYGTFVVKGTATQLAVNASSGKARVGFFENGTGRFYIDTLNGSDGLAFVDADGSSERLRITSGGTIQIPNQNAINELEFTGTEYTNIYSATTSGMDVGTTGSGYLRLLTNNTERMRIDSSGTLLVGKTEDGTSNAGHVLFGSGAAYHIRSGGFTNFFNRTSSDGEILRFAKDGSTFGKISVQQSSLSIGGSSTGAIYFNAGTDVRPWNKTANTNADNTLNLGSSNSRWEEFFCANDTINTSDRNEKQDIEALSDAEQRVAVAAKGLLRKYRWKDAVAEKGDDARIHFGIIAQDLQDAFTAEGLDVARYAMWCSDTWTNDDGSEQTRLGVRYSELLAFIISAI